MPGPDIFEIIRSLRAENRAFCLATVVRTSDLTSAKAGAKAVVTVDGEIRGHLGGSCVQRAVRTAAVEILSSDAARIISVRPDGAPDAAEPDVEVHHSGCPSGGTVDVFLESYKMPPRLWICGETPIAYAIEAHASLMGLDVVRSSGVDGGEATGAEFAIIASQGHGDAAALKAAVVSGAGHIAMIASHRKAEVLRARLAADGIDPMRLAVIESPAGLDIGAIDPHEIAVSVLAGMIAAKRRT